MFNSYRDFRFILRSRAPSSVGEARTTSVISDSKCLEENEQDHGETKAEVTELSDIGVHDDKVGWINF